MASIGQGPGLHEVRYDDVPIELHAAEIVAILERESPTTFAALFDGQAERLQIIGRFLALLELIRSHRIRAEQETTFGVIYVFLLDAVDEPSSAEPRSGPPPSQGGAGGGLPENLNPPNPESTHEHTE
jgi:hypothetical protein